MHTSRVTRARFTFIGCFARLRIYTCCTSVTHSIKRCFQQLGIDDLNKGYHMEGIRRILCIMTLLGYHLIVLYVLSHQEGDLEMCEEILKNQLKKYPSGVWFLFFKGRLEFMRCNLDTSLEWYTRSWKSQNMWPQFHHICFWELLWLHW